MCFACVREAERRELDTDRQTDADRWTFDINTSSLKLGLYRAQRRDASRDVTSHGKRYMGINDEAKGGRGKGCGWLFAGGRDGWVDGTGVSTSMRPHAS